MSHEVDGTYRVYDERFPRARTATACHACRNPIRRGDRYAYIFIVSSEGDPETVKRCLACQKTHEHLRSLCEAAFEWRWPDERLNCGQDYEGEWGGPPPDDIARLAFLTPDEIQADLAAPRAKRTTP